MKNGQDWKAFLTFSRKDRIGILSLITLIGITWFTPTIVEKLGLLTPPKLDTNWLAKVTILEQNDTVDNEDIPVQNQYQKSHYSNSVPPGFATSSVLFEFDPNVLDEAGWNKLGVKPKTVATILKFRSKGGRFYNADDLEKIYGLPDFMKQRLKPYVRIFIITNKKENFRNDSNYRKTSTNNFNHKKIETININDADTADFIQLPGIGAKLALRIVNFREKLGGFYSIAQIGEIYGLADSVLQKISPFLTLKNVTLKKINLNNATADELKAHPYIRYQLANPIISYRKEHGLFKKIEDLRNIMAVTESIFEKLKPYLTVD